jgi:hypothetical protein
LRRNWAAFRKRTAKLIRHHAAMKETIGAQYTIRILVEAALFGFLLENGLNPMNCTTPPMKLVKQETFSARNVA